MIQPELIPINRTDEPMPYPEQTIARSNKRWFIAAWTVCLGIILAIFLVLQMISIARPNFVGDYAWFALIVGTSLTAAGVVFPFVRRGVVIIVALLAPPAAFFLAVVVFWSIVLLSAAWADPDFEQKMVRSGYAQIPQAAEIDALVGPARHQVSNFREQNEGEWISTAYFGGRYELTMHLHVEFDSSTSRITRLLEEPKFMLGEITEVQGRGVSYGHWHEFGAAEWEQVVQAEGDFSVISITLDLDHPLPGFEKYQKMSRSGMIMSVPSAELKNDK